MIIILFWIGLAIAVGVFASNRGRSGFGWFLLAVLISPLLGGIFLLLAKNLTPQIPQVVTIARSDDDFDYTKKCPRCAEDVKRAAQVCRFCGHEFTPGPKPDDTKPEPLAAEITQRLDQVPVATSSLGYQLGRSVAAVPVRVRWLAVILFLVVLMAGVVVQYELLLRVAQTSVGG